MSEPGNGYAFRLASIERRVDRLEQLEPAVVKAQIMDVREDIQQLAREIGYVRKVLTGFLVTFAFAAITTVISIFVITSGAG